MFDKKGQLIIDKEEYEGDSDELMMLALDAGAEDFTEEEDSFEIITAPDDFDGVLKALQDKQHCACFCGSDHDSPELRGAYR